MYQKTIVIFLLLLYSTALSQTTTTFTGPANCEDTYLDEGNTTTNYGSGTTFESGQTGGGTNYNALLRVFNLDDTIPVGANVIACTLKIYRNDISGGTMRWQRVCKPWNVSQATWQLWQTTSGNWATDGALTDGSASCVDCYNTGDNTGSDISGVESNIVLSFGSTGYTNFVIDTCIANAWVNKTDSTNGINIYATSNAGPITWDAVNGTNPPQWVFVWTAPPVTKLNADGRHAPSSRHGDNAPLLRHGAISTGPYYMGNGTESTNSETIGDTTATLNFRGNQYTTKYGGDMDSVFLFASDNFNGDDTVSILIYDDNAGSPNNLIAESGDIEVTSSTNVWHAAAITGTLSANTTYWILIYNKTATDPSNVKVSYDPKTITGIRGQDQPPANDPFGSGVSTPDEQYSVYVRYQ